MYILFSSVKIAVYVIPIAAVGPARRAARPRRGACHAAATPARPAARCVHQREHI